MKKFLKKLFILAFQGSILLLLIVSVIYLPYVSKPMLLYSGYYFEQERYLTTQEKFDLVVTSIINRKRSCGFDEVFSNPVDGWRRAYMVNEAGGKVNLNKAVETSFRYSSLKEFYTLNPNCCELVEAFLDEGATYDAPFAERIKGRFNILVRVFYIYDFDEENDNQPIYKEEYFGLSNCGVVWTAEQIMKLHLWGVPLGSVNAKS